MGFRWMALSSPKMSATAGSNPGVSKAVKAHRFLIPPSLLFFREKTSASGPLIPLSYKRVGRVPSLCPWLAVVS